MSILYVKEIAGRRVSVTRENVRTGVRKFRVRSNVPDESTFAIRTHPSIPKPWSGHPTEPFTFADVPVITQQKNKYFWDVEVDYTSDVDGEEQEKNPLQRRADIEWTSQEFQRLAFLDEQGRPILNTAGDPPEGGGLPIDDSFWVISVTKNVTNVPKRIVLENYASSVNEDTVRIDGIEFPPNTLKAKTIRIGKRDFEEGVRFRQMTVSYHSTPETWTQEILNRGFRQLVARKVTDPDDEDATIVEVTPEKILVGSEDGQAGEPPSEPVFLDEFGYGIQKPSRTNIRKLDGGTSKDPEVLPTDPDELKKELKKRSDIIVLKWNVEKKRQFRGVLPLA